MSADIVSILAAAAGPRREPASLAVVRVVQSSPLVVEINGEPIDAGIRTLSTYAPSVGDPALLIRAGGLAVLVGRVN